MFFYCHSLSDVDFAYCVSYRKFLQKKALVELRLDLLDFDTEQVKDFFRQTEGLPSIATYRLVEEEDEEMMARELDDAVRLLSAAVMAGAAYIDIDLEMPENERGWLITLALNYNCGIIVSYHNYYGVQSVSELRATASRCFVLGADIVKVATTARHPDEAESVLALYDFFPPDKLVAFAMGTYGRLSRVRALDKGCPLYYVSPRQSRLISEGQPTVFDILDKEYKKLVGDVKAPCSASYAVRAIIAAALCRGESRIRQVNLSLDVTAAMNVARQLGAQAHYNKKTRIITVKGDQQDIAEEGLKVEGGVLNAGESSLVAEICLALATLSREPVTVTGEKSLLKKRFAGTCTPLLRHGVTMSFTQGRLPVEVSGRPTPGTWIIDGTRRAGIVTGLLFALPMLNKGSKLIVRKAVGVPYIRMTMNILERFGYGFNGEDFSGEDIYVTFRGRQKMHPGRLRIEGDWTGAALWMVMGVTVGESMVRRLPLESDQGGNMILDVIDKAGGDVGYFIDEKAGGNRGDFSALRSVTFAFTYDLAETPDLIGPLLMLALRSEGTSVLTGISRLNGWDAERLRNFVTEFRRLGAEIVTDGDRMEITGSFDNKLHGGKAASHGDPLLAMALSAANLISEGEIEITDRAAAEKTWPGFRC
jgi:3-phosphoshikimate 1-carboxyvinyltransferase